MINIVAILNYCFAFSIVFTHVGGYITSGLGFLVELPKVKDIIRSHLVKTIIVFLIYGMIISYFSKMPSVGYSVMLNYFSHWLIPFVLGYSLRESRKIEKAFKVFYFTFFVLFLFSICAYFGLFWKNISEFYLVEGGRLSGLRNPIAYGALLTIFSFISFAISMSSKNIGYKKYIFSIFGVLFLFGVILTGARGYYIAAFLSMILFLFWIGLRKKNIFLALVILFTLIFAPIVSYNVFPTVRTRVRYAFSGRDASVLDRMELSKIALLIIKDNPIFGVGPGQATYQKEYFEKEKIDFYSNDGKPRHGHIHSFHLDILAEFGIIGFILFILVTGQIFGRLLKIYRAKNELLKSLSIGLFFGFISLLIGEFFDTHLSGPRVAMELFWLTGLLFGLKDEN